MTFNFIFNFFLLFINFQIAFLALAACVVAEPPSGYSYSRPSGGHGGYSSGGGHSSFGGGLSSGHGGGYEAVPHGYQSNEGQFIDPQLLHKIKHILLEQEQLHGSGSGFGGGHSHGLSSSYGVPSSSYGVPSSSYGVPSYQTRVVGIELGHVNPAIQVAQYRQTSYGHGGHGGYPASVPSISYGAPQHYSAPSVSYGAPQVHYSAPAVQYAAPQVHYSAPIAEYHTAPSSSYGTPSAPSGSYGVPHHH